ncbi:MAG TPA: putative zinc-binding metallopeptidase [Bryobacteraceae bacterium]|jgi:hypothetical protein|nr:putative zinc-binding metallopeptidase [Bryobacteraceae bacterium]
MEGAPETSAAPQAPPQPVLQSSPKPASVSAPAAPPWAALKDEELVALRLCDLNLRIEGSELEPRIQQLYAELAARGVTLRPDCYLGDEWFSPRGVPAIAIPFYLAHPRLKALELHEMMEVEGGTPEWCMMLLRHECGHAVDHAWQFSRRKDWHRIFGSPEADYAPETYSPRPHSHGFVRHLPNWYAQAHPDEDFAETFAVWLSTPMDELRERYRGWKALEKIEYVDSLMRDAAVTKPVVRRGRRLSEARRLRKTLARHYAARRKLYAEDFPDFYDADLRAIFLKGEPGPDSAARAMRRRRAALIAAIVEWTGQRKYTVDMLVNKLTRRCQELKLPAPRDPVTLQMDLAAYLSALVTNHFYTGRFKRSV